MSSQASNPASREVKKNARQVKVALLGLNRVTASLGLALRDYSHRPNSSLVFTLAGRDDNHEAMKAAEKNGAIDEAHKSLKQVVTGAGIVILGAPPGNQEEVFARLGEILEPGAVVLDLSPLKQPGVELARRYFPKDDSNRPTAYLVGVTPLVSFAALYGLDQSVEAARADLFLNSQMLIAPDASTPANAVKVVTDLAELLQMTPRFMDPPEHDGLASVTEGMPALLGLAVFYLVCQSPGKDDLLRALNFNFAGMTQGLRYDTAEDLTAKAYPNRVYLRQHIGQMIVALETLRDLLADDDPLVFSAFAGEVIQSFDEWQARREKNRWEGESTPDLRNIQPNISFGQMFGFRPRKDKDGN